MNTGPDEFERLQRDSGIPPKGSLGAARNELYGLMVAVAVLLMIGGAFLWQALR